MPSASLLRSAYASSSVSKRSIVAGEARVVIRAVCCRVQHCPVEDVCVENATPDTLRRRHLLTLCLFASLRAKLAHVFGGALIARAQRTVGIDHTLSPDEVFI